MNPAFFARDPVIVARELLGHHVRQDDVVLRITETEAYRGGLDTASHTMRGMTPRNAPMFGPPGHAYIYLCYGIHHLLNVVCWPDGRDGAVLIRAAEPVAGRDTIARRRGGKTGPVQLTGPGKIGAALGLTTAWSGTPMLGGGPVILEMGTPPVMVLTGPRVGIDYAEAQDRDAPWRFAVAATPWVSVRKTLS